MTEEKEFKNYKEQQNYYKELYKNRGKYLFAQNAPATLFADNRMGTIKPQKGKTYIKDNKVGV